MIRTASILARLTPSLLLALFPFLSPTPSAPAFQFPTANRALLDSGREEHFFVGTAGRTWTSGMFGCVRSEGTQFHEGIDIRCLKRDKSGEPIDPVLAAAEGSVVYVNRKAGLSNYGMYVVLRHRIEGLDVYTLYAHLRSVPPEVKPGRKVQSGELIGVMGRSSNTRQQISKERAHVHFEINLILNEQFPDWFKTQFPGQRNDHGQWNGQNLVGLDPAEILKRQEEEGSGFSFLRFVRNQPELCRVLVRATNLSWIRHYAPLVRRNPVAEQEGAAGFEVALNYAGVPFQLIPRAPSEIPSGSKFQLLSVNEEEQSRHPCRRLVVKRGGKWELGTAGRRLLELLVY